MKLINAVTGKEVEMKPQEALLGEFGTVVLQPKKFSSGSIGMYAGGRVTAADGSEYQLSCSITLIGSKPPQEKANF